MSFIQSNLRFVSPEFLHSNLNPVRQRGRTFYNAFYDLIRENRSLDIAVGYITTDSLMDLEQLTKLYNLRVNLTIGMHYLDKFTPTQYKAALRLNDFLRNNERGQVQLVTTFRYHGKLYSFSDIKGASAGIIGSNNLGSIVDGNSREYESAVLLRDPSSARQIKDFIDLLVSRSTDNIANLDIQSFDTKNRLLEEQENVRLVERVELDECLSSLTSTVFEIPIKAKEDDSPQSNMNVYFGKGRENKRTGRIIPRHWYEVELIVPSRITTMLGYPISGTEFNVITDDGWSFGCKISGDNNKNFRSKGDLKILGKWLKGRLENAGVLTVGDYVTRETFKKYGRNSFSLIKTTKPNLWYLDFSNKPK